MIYKTKIRSVITKYLHNHVHQTFYILGYVVSSWHIVDYLDIILTISVTVTRLREVELSSDNENVDWNWANVQVHLCEIMHQL